MIGTLSNAQFLGFFIALFLSLIFVPLVRRKAFQLGLVDQPNERKIHNTPVPRFGGIGIWSGFVLAFVTLCVLFKSYPLGQGVTGMLAGGTIIFLVGVLDDRYDISPYLKLAGQIVAALVAYALGVQIEALDLPDSKLLVLHSMSLPVTVFWLIAVANAMNLIDGVDGLAGGVVTISAITLAVVAVFTHQPLAALMAALLAGGSLGFLIYNFYPARIFMGDSGSLFCGFTLACIAVTGVLKTKIAVVLVPMLILALPIVDLVWAFSRRILRGKNPFIADAEHIHHRLLKAGYSQVWIVAILYGTCIVVGMLATGYVQYLYTYIALVIGLIVLTSALLMLRFTSNLEEMEKLETHGIQGGKGKNKVHATPKANAKKPAKR